MGKDSDWLPKPATSNYGGSANRFINKFRQILAINNKKRYLTQRVKIYKKISLPLWNLICLVLVGIYLLTNTFSYSSNAISSPKSSIKDYSYKKFGDKFNLKYKSVDKSKVQNRWIGNSVDEPFQIGCIEPDTANTKKRANATLVVLARNKELGGVLKSMNTLERHFNQWHNYPWIFLNDEEFTDKFKKQVQKRTKSKVEFGLISNDTWDFPLTYEESKGNQFNFFEFYEYIERQGDRGIMYGGMDSYHKMCRFYSGGFYRHPLVRKYEWYWRVEPDVEFYCDLTYDPFLEMEKNGKKYGFTVIIKEISTTIPNLFRITKAFIKEKNIQVKNTWNLFVNQINGFNYDRIDDPDLERATKYLEHDDELISYIENQVQREHLSELLKNNNNNNNNKKADSKFIKKLLDSTLKEIDPMPDGESFDGERYNYCHFWSNFEIARVDVWDNPNYSSYFDYLEQTGGFYKERWGDAPVHSLGAAMFLDLNEIHYFRDIGYKHSTIAHCPHNSFDNQLGYSPSKGYFKFENVDKMKKEDYKWLNSDTPKKNGVGCRCKCPRQPEIEDIGGTCIQDWIMATKMAEFGKFDNKKRTYVKNLDVKQLKDLIIDDYMYYRQLNKNYLNLKYVSSAMKSFHEIKKDEQENSFIYPRDEFNIKLIELTTKLNKERALLIDENNMMKQLKID